MTRQELEMTMKAAARACVEAVDLAHTHDARRDCWRTVEKMDEFRARLAALLDWSEARPPRESFPHPTAYSADLDAREYVARVLRGEE